MSEIAPFIREAMRIPRLSGAEQVRLLKERRPLSALVCSHLEMVAAIAWKWRHTGIDRNELIAEGVVGVLEATRTYRENAGPFTSHAYVRIEQRIRRKAMKERSIVVDAEMVREGNYGRVRASNVQLDAPISIRQTGKVRTLQDSFVGGDLREDAEEAFDRGRARELVEAFIRTRRHPVHVALIRRHLAAESADSLAVLGAEFGLSRQSMQNHRAAVLADLKKFVRRNVNQKLHLSAKHLRPVDPRWERWARKGLRPINELPTDYLAALVEWVNSRDLSTGRPAEIDWSLWVPALPRGDELPIGYVSEILICLHEQDVARERAA